MSAFGNIFKKLWQSELRWPVVGLTALAFILGYWMNSSGDPAGKLRVEAPASAAESTIWTCSMHPQIQQPSPGKCPICGMDLIPVSTGDDQQGSGPRELRLTPVAMTLAEIQTTPVIRKYVAAEIPMAGKVEVDETQVSYITARVPGRIDRLYVDYTGTRVRKGDHLVWLYSPELISAQEELLQALETYRQIPPERKSGFRETMSRTVEAARDKLRLWGLTDAQIREIEKAGKVNDHLTIYSPIQGVVIHKEATEGMYVNTGTRIYTIADLEKVWVKLDAYESDLQWIRYGEPVEFETQAFPGEIFQGVVSFIDPVINPATRTVKVRVNVDNREGRLKPDMFVRARLHAHLSASGKVMVAELAGKWICPMHPEVIKEIPGHCDLCGMSLLKAEKLGYVSAEQLQTDAPLVIPASAPLITGKRAVVYVAIPGKPGAFEGREIVLGPRAGDYYLVQEGLREGEQVVTRGAFKLDSDLQIQAKPSMMNPEGGAAMTGHQHGGEMRPETAVGQPPSAGPAEEFQTFPVPEKFTAALEFAVKSYFAIQRALARDDAPPAQKAAADFRTALEKIDMQLLPGEAHRQWMTRQKEMQSAAAQLRQSRDLDPLRRAFAALSGALYAAIKQFGHDLQEPVYRYHCPMAFDGAGADWLQNHSKVENPYFGAAMFTCGNQTGIIAGPEAHAGHGH